MYLKDFFIMLVMITVGLSLIFCLLDVIEKIDDFKPDAFSAGQVTLYALLRLPSYLLYLLPVSVLISSLFTFSQAYRRFEIPAIKAAGGKLRAFFYPFIVTGILISLFAFMINEGIAPDFSRRALAIKNELKGKTKKYAFREGSMWLKSTTGDPVKIDLFVFDKRLVHGIDIFVLGDAVLRERISAEKAFWNGSIWSLEQVTRYDFDSGTIHELKTLDYHNLEAPEIFAEKIKKPEEMNISELYRYAERLKNAGFRNVRLAVDLHSKISFPFINIFMMVLGISLSSRKTVGSGLISAGLALLICLFYWFGYTFMLSLGYAGIIMPVIAAWIIPSLFAILSLYLFVTVPE
jgi:lipopolysaccharide export system permease protein